jgi:hypothetical protein
LIVSFVRTPCSDSKLQPAQAGTQDIGKEDKELCEGVRCMMVLETTQCTLTQQESFRTAIEQQQR